LTNRQVLSNANYTAWGPKLQAARPSGLLSPRLETKQRRAKHPVLSTV